MLRTTNTVQSPGAHPSVLPTHDAVAARAMAKKANV